MSGTLAGGRKAAKTNKKQFGKDFYKIIGSKGGQKKGVKKGFATNPQLAKAAGAKGGRNSRRGPEGSQKEKKYIWEGGPDATLVFTED